MNILALDTSGPVAGCAVMTDDVLRASIVIQHGLTHSQTILPAVDEALTAAGLTAMDVDLFAAVAGPGSFTGVRIGVATVKGLAHAAGRPCARLNALEVLAMNYAGFDGCVVPILDARRGQVYAAAYDVSAAAPKKLLPCAALPIEDLFKDLPDQGRLVFLGDGLRVHREAIARAFGARALIAPPNLSDLKPEAACALAAQLQEEAYLPAQALVPIYLRAPQAVRERERRAREGGVRGDH